jgi:acyl-coenzyme A synthetase/AMP-(fatty) acid ligase
MLVLRGGLEEGRFPRLRTILFAGEVFPTKYLRELMRLLPHVRFCNLYGPTETNVCTWYDVPPIAEAETEPIPIGRAISGVEVFPVGDDGDRPASGEPGELYVRGPTVMRGYWGDEDRTVRSLVPTPFTDHPPDLSYRTGDLVVADADGNYRLLGRRDHQIKSRGYRIELGDIESALYSHPSIVECAVVATPDELVTNRIHAYVVVRDPVDRMDLVRFCRSRLPKHMIPETFEFREVLPKTSTGKVDRRSLVTTTPEGERTEARP